MQWEIDEFTKCPNCSRSLAYIVLENLTIKFFCTECNFTEIRSTHIKYLIGKFLINNSSNHSIQFTPKLNIVTRFLDFLFYRQHLKTKEQPKQE